MALSKSLKIMAELGFLGGHLFQCVVELLRVFDRIVYTGSNEQTRLQSSLENVMSKLQTFPSLGPWLSALQVLEVSH
uniref:Uncharacterized protein n=1 Tax=Arundo donax TaxID=35708 RepID=A0A0A9V2T9_ARUDO